MIKHFLLLILLCLPGIMPVIAQEVEFEIPTDISIVPGQLSVVFHEDITEERARALIESMHYEILEVKFSPLQIIGQVETEISDRKMERLNREKEIVSIVRFSDPILVQEEHASFKVAATFKDGVKEARAKKLLKKHLSLVQAKVLALPKEIIIQVGENDEQAFDVLQNHKDVRWVTYVGESEGY